MNTKNKNVYTIQENGLSMKSDKVAVPACRITATGFVEASNKLTEFLQTRVLPPEIELITPMERIDFSHWFFNR